MTAEEQSLHLVQWPEQLAAGIYYFKVESKSTELAAFALAKKKPPLGRFG